jgi:putative transcriptional regulator
LLILKLMDAEFIFTLRRDLGLSQSEFGQLFGSHSMTVSKWERALLSPSAYQQALMQRFRQTADAQKAQSQEQVKNLLVGAGVVAALVWLLGPGK